MVDHVCWPETEVRRFLKTRRLSLHDFRNDARIVEAGPHVTIYADEGVCRGALPLLNDWSDERSRALSETATNKDLRAKRSQLVATRKLEKRQKEILAKLQRFGRVPVRVEIEDGAFSRVLSNPGTTPDRTGGMRLWRNVPGT
jgi:hypothetical protein